MHAADRRAGRRWNRTRSDRAKRGASSRRSISVLTSRRGWSAAPAIAWRGIRCRPRRSALAERADGILFGAVGDPACDGLERAMRPEQAILGLRKALGLFANLRPAKLFNGLEEASALRPDVAREIDMVILRELTGDVYFGEKGSARPRRAAPGL